MTKYSNYEKSSSLVYVIASVAAVIVNYLVAFVMCRWFTHHMQGNWLVAYAALFTLASIFFIFVIMLNFTDLDLAETNDLRYYECVIYAAVITGSLIGISASVITFTDSWNYLPLSFMVLILTCRRHYRRILESHVEYLDSPRCRIRIDIDP